MLETRKFTSMEIKNHDKMVQQVQKMWHLAGNTLHCSSYPTCKCPFNNKSEVKK